jgi:hypothetical protein
MRRRLEGIGRTFRGRAATNSTPGSSFITKGKAGDQGEKGRRGGEKEREEAKEGNAHAGGVEESSPWVEAMISEKNE